MKSNSFFWILDHAVLGLWVPAIVFLWKVFAFISRLSTRAEVVEKPSRQNGDELLPYDAGVIAESGWPP